MEDYIVKLAAMIAEREHLANRLIESYEEAINKQESIINALRLKLAACKNN